MVGEGAKFSAYIELLGAGEAKTAAENLDKTIVKMTSDTVAMGQKTQAATTSLTGMKTQTTGIVAPLRQTTVAYQQQAQVLPKITTTTKTFSAGLKDVGTQTVQARNPLGQLTQSYDQLGKKQTGMMGTLKSVGSGFQSQVGSITAVTGSSWALYNAVDNLEKKELAASKSKLAVEKANLAVSKAQELVNKLVATGQTGTLDYQQAQEALRLAIEKQTLAVEKNEIVQGDLQEDYANLATQILPLLLSVGGSVTSMFQNMNGLMPKLKGALASVRTGFIGVGEGAKGAGISMKAALIGTGIGAVIVGIGLFLEAFANNWFGVRDAINAAGKAIGDIFPFLKPVLDFLGWVGGGIEQAFGSDTQNALAETGEGMAATATEAQKYQETLKLVDEKTKNLQKSTGLTAAELIDELGPAFVQAATGADTLGKHTSKLAEFQTKIAQASQALAEAQDPESIKKASDHLRELIGNYNEWIAKQDEATQAQGLNNKVVAEANILGDDYVGTGVMLTKTQAKLVDQVLALHFAEDARNISVAKSTALLKTHNDIANDMFSGLETENKHLADLAVEYGLGIKAITKYTAIKGLTNQETQKLNDQFATEIMQTGLVSSALDSGTKVLERWTKVQTYLVDQTVAERDSLIDLGLQVGLTVNELDKYIDTRGKSRVAIEEEDKVLRNMILTQAQNTDALFESADGQKAFNDNLVSGVQSANAWYRELVGAGDQQIAFDDQIRQIARDLGVDYHDSITLSIDDLKDLIAEIKDTKAAHEKMRDEFNKGVDVLGGITEEKLGAIRDALKQGKGEKKIPKGLRGEKDLIVVAKMQLSFDDEDVTNKTQSFLEKVEDKLRAGKTESAEAYIKKWTADLVAKAANNPALAKIFDPLIKFGQESGGKTGDEYMADFIIALGKMDPNAVGDLIIPPGVQAIIDERTKAAGTSIETNVTDKVTGLGTEVGNTEAPLDEFQTQMKEIQDLNKVMNTHYIEGMNAMGNKTEEFRNFAGTRFNAVKTQLINNMTEINKVMNSHFIGGLNAGGNKSDQFRSVVDKNMDTMRSITVGNLQNVNKVMNSHFISAMNAGGNKTNEFRSTVQSNMNIVKSAIDKVTGAADLLKQTLDKLKDKEFTVTTHYEHTGTPPDGPQAKGGVYFLPGGHARSFIAGEKTDEIAAFFPITREGEQRQGKLDIRIPSPKIQIPDVNIPESSGGGFGTAGMGEAFKSMAREIVGAIRNQVTVLNATFSAKSDGHKLYEVVSPYMLRGQGNHLG